MLFVNKTVISLFVVLVVRQPALAQQGRYRAVLDDGRMVSGEVLTGWHAAGRTVTLDGEKIASPGKPPRWMRNRSLTPWRVDSCRSGYVEFVGGDRLVGTLSGAEAGDWSDGMFVPDHLRVRPASTKRLYSHGTDEEIIRILPRSIRRVVFRSDLPHKFQPGSVFLRDRRRLSFISIRWGGDSVQLLLKSGSSSVRLADICEIHMPPSDPWEAYYRQIAVLSPDCRTRLIRLETSDGLVATGSEDRFAATPFYSDTILHHAMARRRHYVRQLEQLKAREVQHQKKYEKHEHSHREQIAALEAAIRRDTAAHAKALAGFKTGLDEKLKADAATFDKERENLRAKYRKEVANIEKRVARLPESQRNSKRKLYVATKKRNLDRLLKSVDRRQASSTRRRSQEHEKLGRELALKLQQVAQARQKLASERARSRADTKGRRYYLDQIEATKKLIAALPGPEGNSATWCHMVQPAWSLDPLWVKFNTIVMRSVFSPHIVPLSRMSPSKTASPDMLPWRLNRNTDGALLRSGLRVAGSGFGVHAPSELAFDIPPLAVSFRSRVGLDRVVEGGGCVRARVRLDSTESRPAYESPLLIGSDKTVDTGRIALRSSGDRRRSLILQADPVVRGYPAGADPLNIRDKLDWLDPQIILDQNRLRSEVRVLSDEYVSAWRGWTAEFDKAGDYKRGSWHDPAARFERGLFLPTMSAKGKPLKLRRRMKIAASDKWLIVDVGSAGAGGMKDSAVRLRIDGREIPAEKTPVRQYWRRRTPPLVFPLENHSGKDASLELAQSGDGSELYWRSIRTSSKLPAEHLLKRVLDESGKGDMRVTRGLGLTLQSGRIKKSYVLEALEIMRLGGRVTFCNEVTGQFRYEYLYGVMIGCDWKGGDKGFAALKNLRWVRNILLAKDSGVSDGAVAQLKSAKGEDFVLRTVERTPSAWGGMSCTLTMRNQTKSDLTISRVHGWGGLTQSFVLKAGAELAMHAHEGQRYEAHAEYGARKKSKPTSWTWVNGDTVWEIK